jgi:hypothetical protein
VRMQCRASNCGTQRSYGVNGKKNIFVPRSQVCIYIQRSKYDTLHKCTKLATYYLIEKYIYKCKEQLAEATKRVGCKAAGRFCSDFFVESTLESIRDFERFCRFE